MTLQNREVMFWMLLAAAVVDVVSSSKCCVHSGNHMDNKEKMIKLSNITQQKK